MGAKRCEVRLCCRVCQAKERPQKALAVAAMQERGDRGRLQRESNVSTVSFSQTWTSCLGLCGARGSVTGAEDGQSSTTISTQHKATQRTDASMESCCDDDTFADTSSVCTLASNASTSSPANGRPKYMRISVEAGAVGAVVGACVCASARPKETHKTKVATSAARSSLHRKPFTDRGAVAGAILAGDVIATVERSFFSVSHTGRCTALVPCCQLMWLCVKKVFENLASPFAEGMTPHTNEGCAGQLPPSPGQAASLAKSSVDHTHIHTHRGRCGRRSFFTRADGQSTPTPPFRALVNGVGPVPKEKVVLTLENSRIIRPQRHVGSGLS
jgi:hypothetical protein